MRVSAKTDYLYTVLWDLQNLIIGLYLDIECTCLFLLVQGNPGKRITIQSMCSEDL